MNFDRIYPSQLVKRKERTNSPDESSLSGSDAAPDDEGKSFTVYVNRAVIIREDLVVSAVTTKKIGDPSFHYQKTRRKKKQDPVKVDDNGIWLRHAKTTFISI